MCYRNAGLVLDNVNDDAQASPYRIEPSNVHPTVRATCTCFSSPKLGFIFLNSYVCIVNPLSQVVKSECGLEKDHNAVFRVSARRQRRSARSTSSTDSRLASGTTQELPTTLKLAFLILPLLRTSESIVSRPGVSLSPSESPSSTSSLIDDFLDRCGPLFAGALLVATVALPSRLGVPV